MNRITKLALLFFVFSLTVLLTHESLAVGFSKGNSFQTTPIYGNVWAQCMPQPGMPGGPTSQYFSCSAILWSPGLSDYFIGPQGVRADHVTLRATRQDGSHKEKDSDYDSSKGQSTSRFNLGITTLTQRPLLKNGLNKIHYTLSLNGQTVTEGDFEASVTEQSEKQCPAGNFFSPGYYDCQNQFVICDRYFAENNYCQ